MNRCSLTDILIYPYSLPIDRAPALALSGIYQVEAPELIEYDGIPIRQVRTGYDRDPVHFYIDTHGGNFEYISCIVTDGNRKVLELSPQFSEHMAQIMLAYYKQEVCVSGNGIINTDETGHSNWHTGQ